MKRSKRYPLALFALLAFACSDDEDPRGPYACERDDELLAANVECVEDVDCPCGMACGPGVCTATCKQDDDCAGDDTCDAFGRCRNDGGNLIAPAPPAVGRLTLPTTSIQLDPAHLASRFVMRATSERVAPVRVVAEPPVVLECPDGAEQPNDQECVVAALEPGDGPLAVGVRLPDAPVKAALHDLNVFWGDDVTTVDIRATPAPIDAPEPPLAGVWRGVATLERSGSVARTNVDDTPETLSSLALPVELRIFEEVGNARRVVMSDIAGFVFPEAPTVGELRRSGEGTLRLDHVARPYVTGESENLDAAKIVAAATSVSVERQRAGLVVDLRTTFGGVVSDSFGPFIDWRLRLARVGDLEEDETPPDLPEAIVVADSVTAAQAPLVLQTSATPRFETALAGLTGAERTQAVLCTEANTDIAIFLDPDAASPWSGDLACLDAPPNDLQRVFGPYRETAWGIAQTIGGCVSDLELTRTLMTGASTTMTPSGCFDGARFALALAEAQDVDLRRVQGEAVAADLAQSAIAHRLLQQLVHVLAFITAQSVQIDRLNDVLDASAGISRDFTQGDMLDLTSMGWDLLLHPRVAMPLALMPGPVVEAPDYRRRLFPNGDFVGDTRHDVNVGFPVALARNLGRSLDAHGALLERARFVSNERDVIETRAVSFTRRSIVLFAFATLLYDYARAASAGPVAWETQFEDASSAFGVSLTGLVRALENLREGRNPLDIDDELDLPLYRVGDETSSLSRFSALTDYLLGADGTNDGSPVGAAIAQAESDLDAARDSYADLLRDDLQYRINEQRQLAREFAIRSDFGDAVVSLCGDPDLDPDRIVSGAQEVDPERCWIRADCRRDGNEALSALAPEVIAETLCTIHGLFELAGGSAVPANLVPSDPAFADVAAGRVTVHGHEVGQRGDIVVRTSDGRNLPIALELYRSKEPPPEIDPELLFALNERCRAVGAATEGARSPEAGACDFHGDCPSGYLCESRACVVDTGTALPVGCFQGSVGETAAALRAAATDVEIARSELDDLIRAYDLRMQACNNLMSANDAKAAAIEAHLAVMTALDAAQLIADITAHYAAATKDCAGGVGPENVAASVVSCSAAYVEATALSVSDTLQTAMDEATRRHEQAIDEIDRKLEERNCIVEAQQELVASNTAALRIRRAVDEVGALLVQLENGKSDIAVSVAGGKDDLALQVSTWLTPIEFDYFLDENIVRYDQSFRRARRAMYLGVLAFEYEYQVSSSERASVLAATRIDDLRDVLTRLRSLAATGTVNGAAPTDLFVVLSLRDELLALADRRGRPRGLHTPAPPQRFRMLLGASQYRAFDADGNYVGQQIPFRLAPLPELGSDASGAIPILSGADCAERLFAINASILGTEVLVGTESTRTRITVRKRNSFYSQWCSTRQDGPAVQYASTRPSRNLFLDPFTDYDPASRAPSGGNETFEEIAEANAFTSARITPTINVARADFESDTYLEGASRELAGRGVYGDYVLFLPAESLSRNGSGGLDLEAIDDILLRIDYTSVASD